MKLFLLLLILTLPSCQEEKKQAKPNMQKEANTRDTNEKEKQSLLNVPAGAVIENLVLPYYNDNRKKVSLLTIKEVTVANDARIDLSLIHI